jgi:hypothetical protein
VKVGPPSTRRSRAQRDEVVAIAALNDILAGLHDVVFVIVDTLGHVLRAGKP